MSDRIYFHHAQCMNAFKIVLAHTQRIEVPSNGVRIGNEIESEYQRYKVWAGTVGAGHKGETYQLSLDYRLRDASFYKAQIIRIIDILGKSRLAYHKLVTSILRGTRKPFESIPHPDLDADAPPEEEEEIENNSPWEISDSENEEEVQAQALDRLRDQKPTELVQLMNTIKLAITGLYRIPIRQPAPVDRLSSKSILDMSIYQHFDCLYVRDKFPRMDANLADRLGKMITKRRETLLYRLAHDERLRTDLDDRDYEIIDHSQLLEGGEPQTDPTSQNDQPSGPARSVMKSAISAPHTEATKLKGDPKHLETDFLYEPSIAESKSSMASSFAAKIQLEIPPRPKNPDGKSLDSFKCPYCQLACHVKSDHQWKKHVLNDIQPYVCTYSDCELFDHFFANKEDWRRHEHTTHRVQYLCNAPGHAKYSSKTDFGRHLQAEHDSSLNEQQLTVLVEAFRRPTQSPVEICPLCLRESQSLSSHVVRHLQQLALFALPRQFEIDEKGSGAVVRGSVNKEDFNGRSGDESDESHSSAKNLEVDAEVNIQEESEQIRLSEDMILFLNLDLEILMYNEPFGQLFGSAAHTRIRISDFLDRRHKSQVQRLGKALRAERSRREPSPRDAIQEEQAVNGVDENDVDRITRGFDVHLESWTYVLPDGRREQLLSRVSLARTSTFFVVIVLRRIQESDLLELLELPEAEVAWDTITTKFIEGRKGLTLGNQQSGDPILDHLIAMRKDNQSEEDSKEPEERLRFALVIKNLPEFKLGEVVRISEDSYSSEDFRVTDLDGVITETLNKAFFLEVFCSPATIRRLPPFVVKARSTCAEKAPGELAFKYSDLILVTKKPSYSWWTGVCNGRTGDFPVNFIDDCMTWEEQMVLEHELRMVDFTLESLMCERYECVDPGRANDLSAQLHSLDSGSRDKRKELLEHCNQMRDLLTAFNEMFIKARREYEGLLERSLEHPPIQRLPIPPPSARAWICCQCKAANYEPLAPDRCPICQHWWDTYCNPAKPSY